MSSLWCWYMLYRAYCVVKVYAYKGIRDKTYAVELCKWNKKLYKQNENNYMNKNNYVNKITRVKRWT